MYFAFPRQAAIYGNKVANEIAEFQLQHVLAVKDLVEKEKIDCDFQLTRACDVFIDQEYADKFTAAFEKIKASGATCVRQVQYTGPRDAEQVSIVVIHQYRWELMESDLSARYPESKVRNVASPFRLLTCGLTSWSCIYCHSSSPKG